MFLLISLLLLNFKHILFFKVICSILIILSLCFSVLNSLCKEVSIFINIDCWHCLQAWIFTFFFAVFSIIKSGFKVLQSRINFFAPAFSKFLFINRLFRITNYMFLLLLLIFGFYLLFILYLLLILLLLCLCSLLFVLN